MEILDAAWQILLVVLAFILLVLALRKLRKLDAKIVAKARERQMETGVRKGIEDRATLQRIAEKILRENGQRP